MTYTVEVAEAANPDLPVSARISSLPDLEAPWESRLRVAIEVEPDERLGDLLRRAGAQLDQMGLHGSQPEPWTPVYFSTHTEETGIRLWNELSLVDAEGHVRWNYMWQNEPYSELLRASEAGAIPGDPHRLYFIRMGGMGDGVVSTFPEFIQLSSIWWEVLSATFQVAGIASTAEWIAERLGLGERATEVTEEKAEDWKANGAQPFKVKELVRRSQSAADLARLLNVTESDAKALLTAFGCKEGEDGRWWPGEDEASKLMADNMDLLLSSPQIERDAFRGEIQRRLDSFLETGKAPDLDFERMAALPLDPHWSANRQEVEQVEPPFEPFEPDEGGGRLAAFFRRLRR